MKQKHTIQADQFKAECLKIMDEVKKTRRSVIITKHNKPIAKLVPFEEGSDHLFGRMKGTIQIKGDIIEPIGKAWEADS